jgi:hypothetical protein
MYGHLRVYKLLPSHLALDDIRERRLKAARLEPILFPCRKHRIFASGADVTDPFEPLVLDSGRRRLRQIVQEARVHLAATYGLLSFCGSWHNPWMWSHYGAEHTGIALGFDLRGSDAVHHMRYVSGRRRLTAFDGLEPGDRMNELLLQYLLFTRAAHWSYEEEIRRLVVLDGECKQTGEDHYLDFAGNLRLVKVIAGINCRVPKAEIESALTDYDEPVEIIKARASLHAFQVVRDRRGHFA